jgi:hypothetical protein
LRSLGWHGGLMRVAQAFAKPGVTPTDINPPDAGTLAEQLLSRLFPRRTTLVKEKAPAEPFAAH